MITGDDHARIAGAIRSAEARTAGEIVCVVARTVPGERRLTTMWAACLALLSPWLLLPLTQWSVQRILLAQLFVFGAALLLFSWPALRLRLLPRAMRRARAHREALAQFHARGVTRTKARCGVMIFVSLPDRYARIIADEGIASLVRNEEWAGAVALLVEGVRRRDIVGGLVAAIERSGDLLAERAPPTGASDELPDRLYVI